MYEPQFNVEVPGGTEHKLSESTAAIRPLFAHVPANGQAVQVAEGVWWVRLELRGSQDHVNIYILTDANSCTLVDTGNNTEQCRQVLATLFGSEFFATRPLIQVIVTHYHPDHIGLAGLLAEQGATLLMTRTCWQSSLILQLSERGTPAQAQVDFLRKAGVSELELEAYRRRPPSNYSVLVYPLPFAYRRIKSGDELKIGSRRWIVEVGNGHAAEHATFWSDDGLAIVGDQLLPNISPNLSVHPSEPEADLATEWFDSCRRMAELADEETICLPGHGVPYIGVKKRCEQLADNLTGMLNRLYEHLAKPQTVVGCMSAVYRRVLQSHEREPLIGEVVGLLNHLRSQNKVRCEQVGNVCLWSQVSQRYTTHRFDDCVSDSGISKSRAFGQFISSDDRQRP